MGFRFRGSRGGNIEDDFEVIRSWRSSITTFNSKFVDKVDVIAENKVEKIATDMCWCSNKLRQVKFVNKVTEVVGVRGASRKRFPINIREIEVTTKNDPVVR